MLLFPNNEYMYAHNLTQQLRHMRAENRFKKVMLLNTGTTGILC